MSRQDTAVSQANMESYRDQWLREGGVSTVGDVRDRISDMCLDLHIAISELPVPLHDLFDRLRFYDIRDAARLETLLEAIEQSIDGADS